MWQTPPSPNHLFYSIISVSSGMMDISLLPSSYMTVNLVTVLVTVS